ncbi:MAG: hypothetical protein CMO55_27460 [Verrucomicrobiales bacterium]|nr:hypothetical protein [Verrucomicrobiales bacterium]
MKLPFCLLTFLALSIVCNAIDRPNVIFMMADDMGMGDTSAYQDFTGNADEVQLATPNMERLARMGVRFTDAHTPSSRCSPTRYGLLTGRYPWRNRLKHWVLFGSQGDPMIERDRPTLATLFQDAGYGTAITGKWHVGLRYTRSDGKPASGWDDADLTKPLFDTPVDHGFDFARFTSRSHGTSGPDAAGKGKKKKAKNGPNQTVGPGHIHDRVAIGATGDGKEIVRKGDDAYFLTELGGRHSDFAIEYLSTHLEGGKNAEKPFFLYYPSVSNHSPYTPDTDIDGKPSRGAAKTKAGELMDLRHDFIYENDLILGRFLDWLEANDDPRNPGKKLIETTIVVFTSDNGAEKNSDVATGPFRSHKGSTYEGGHRVPFLVTGPGIGDGDASGPGVSNTTVMCHTDMFATFAEILKSDLPDRTQGEKGAEDSISVLPAWRDGETLTRPPIFAHDHKEAKDDPAVSALRMDSPEVDGKIFEGQWKMFFDASLLRMGTAVPMELYDLSSDQKEENNRISEPELEQLVDHLKKVAEHHRNAGGHRLADISSEESLFVDFASSDSEVSVKGGLLESMLGKVKMEIRASSGGFDFNGRGMGVTGGSFKQVDEGETLTITFDQDVIVEHVAIVAGNGQCGGFYQVGKDAPLAIYCVDADIDEKDQSGVLSDIGVVKKGEQLLLSSAPHYGTETPGQWRLKAVSVRPLK